MSLSGLLEFVGRSLQRLELRLAQAAGFDSFGECVYWNVMFYSLPLISLTLYIQLFPS